MNVEDKCCGVLKENVQKYFCANVPKISTSLFCIHGNLLPGLLLEHFERLAPAPASAARRLLVLVVVEADGGARGGGAGGRGGWCLSNLDVRSWFQCKIKRGG